MVERSIGQSSSSVPKLNVECEIREERVGEEENEDEEEEEEEEEEDTQDDQQEDGPSLRAPTEWRANLYQLGGRQLASALVIVRGCISNELERKKQIKLRGIFPPDGTLHSPGAELEVEHAHK